MMDIRKVKKLIDLLEQSNLAEIEIKEGDDSVRISRQSQASTTPIMPISAPITATIPSVETTTPAVVACNDNAITSPMVGVFYDASSPTSAAFVNVGQTVKAGDVVCIIEAMKIMNQIEADKSGVVKEILCKGGDSVEFGQDLMIIE